MKTSDRENVTVPAYIAADMRKLADDGRMTLIGCYEEVLKIGMGPVREAVDRMRASLNAASKPGDSRKMKAHKLVQPE